MSTPVNVGGGVVHPALTWLVDQRKAAEPADPLVRRQYAECVQRVGDRDRCGLGRDHAGAEGIGQQVPQRDRAFRRNGVVQWPVGVGEHGHVRQLREEVVDRVIQAQGAVLDERHRTRGDDRLRHRAHATDRVACHGRARPCALEREIARCFDVHLAVADEDGHRTRDEAGVDVPLEQIPHPGQPFRREASTSSHLSPPHLVRSQFTRCDDRTFREDVEEETPSDQYRSSPWAGSNTPRSPSREVAPDLRHERTSIGPSVLLVAIERSKYAEFVAVRIGHHHPTDVVGLADVDAPGTQSFKPKDFSSLIEGSQVKVQAIRPVFFPLLLRLYQPERGASKPELARAMTGIFARAMHPRRVHLVADAAYRSKLWRALPSGRSFTTRLAANATLYAPAPPPNAN